MSDIEELPGQIASQIDTAIQEHNTSGTIDLEKERLKLESQRIKTEERIAERMAERDEKVAETQFGGQAELDQMRSMFTDLMSQLTGLISNATPQISVDAHHENPEIPISSEDITDAPESSEENSEEPENESVEEIGGEAENTNEPVLNTEPKDEPENETRNRGRKRRRSRR